MKRIKRSLLSIGIALVFFLSLAGFTDCNYPAGDSFNLVPPTLSYDAETKTVSWRKVFRATSYVLKIDDGEYGAEGITEKER